MKGFIAITAVLIILLVGLTVGLSVSLSSISEAGMSSKRVQSAAAFYLANLCAEDALMKLKENASYQGQETLTLAGGSCQILQIEGSWTIKVIGNYQNLVKKMRLTVSQITPQMVISSWQEVADF